MYEVDVVKQSKVHVMLSKCEDGAKFFRLMLLEGGGSGGGWEGGLQPCQPEDNLKAFLFVRRSVL